MTQVHTAEAADAALRFLLARIEQQAAADAVSLSREELQQLSFSEETASPAELEATAAFDAANDATHFEKKITKLIRHAYREDVKTGDRATWTRHLNALARKDIYALVMVDQARIRRPKPRLLRTLFPGPLPSWAEVPQLLRASVRWIIPALGILYFIVLGAGPRTHRPGVHTYYFEPLMNRLNLSDGPKGILFVVWVIASLYVLYVPSKPRI